MKTHGLLLSGAITLVLGTFFFWKSAPAWTAPAQTASVSGEQALIEDLVLANRMLASPEIRVLDSYGHVSVRSKTNPSHYYIPRYVAPGLVTVSDIIENDLDSKPIGRPRNDQYPENVLHGEIYKARPDVMAIVHSHTPELVAFSVSSVPLREGAGDPLPIWDMRKFNGPRSGVVNTPEIARALAMSLGRNNAMLLLGHGSVIVSTSAQGLVASANSLRQTAALQIQAIAMRGTVNPNPQGVPPGTGAGATAASQQVAGFTGRNGGDRAWDYWKWQVTKPFGGKVPAAPPPTQRIPARSVATLIEDLVLANRMLASQELGILDSLGHISVRNPRNPNHYFISRAVSAGMVTAEDIIENDLDSKPVAGARNDQFQEVYMHGEIYKARPDVVAIVHAHTPEFVAFGQSSVKLRSVSNGGTFIGDGLPEFVIGKFLNPQEPRVGCAPPCITTPALGQAVATVMGRKPGVLLTGHGIALTDASFYDLVSRVHLLRVNAQIQQMAILLGGQINYLEFPDTPPGPAAPPAAGEFRPPQVDPNLPEGTGGGTFGAPRAWEYWRQITPVD